MTDFIFLDSKITADSNCSHEIKRCLLLGRKAMTNLDSMLKSRDITLPTKVHIVKAVVFPVVMYGCESWTTKKGWAPHNWCFWIVVLKKTLESSLDCKEIKPVNPKGNKPKRLIGRNNEGPILWLSDGKNYSLEKTLMLGKIEGKRRKGWPEAFLSFIISHSVGDAIHLILCHPVLNNDINPFFIIFQ